MKTFAVPRFQLVYGILLAAAVLLLSTIAYTEQRMLSAKAHPKVLQVKTRKSAVNLSQLSMKTRMSLYRRLKSLSYPGWSQSDKRQIRRRLLLNLCLS